MVIGCHGWKNNSQSGDVGEIQSTFWAGWPPRRTFARHNLRVAVSISPAGGRISFKRLGHPAARVCPDQVDFGDRLWRRLPAQNSLPVDHPRTAFLLVAQKAAAESKVSPACRYFPFSPVPNAAKQASPTSTTNHVFVISHSFGALMLEIVGAGLCWARSQQVLRDFKAAFKRADFRTRTTHAVDLCSICEFCGARPSRGKGVRPAMGT